MSEATATPIVEKTAIPNWPESPTMKTYSGACHCRKFEFRVEHPVFEDGDVAVTTCNCSICTSKGILSICTTDDRFQFTSGSWEEATVYRFNKGVVSHYFCPVCGVSFAGIWEKIIGVSVRSLEGIDVDKLSLKAYDGKNIL